MAFTLVRDDGERIVEARGVFPDGGRFKALVTCPPEMRATFDLVVFDAAGASFPLKPMAGLPCGNDVPMPGAFRLTGSSEETVCIVWSEQGEVDRILVSQGENALGAHAMCKHLASAGMSSGR